MNHGGDSRGKSACCQTQDHIVEGRKRKEITDTHKLSSDLHTHAVTRVYTLHTNTHTEKETKCTKKKKKKQLKVHKKEELGLCLKVVLGV